MEREERILILITDSLLLPNPGPKVISMVISESSIDELTAIIQRPPVIWDNLHANDYDQRRLFLGPYIGRSVELIPKLNGVLTNPNCEYGANYIPIHTLAQWSHCGRDVGQRSSPIKQSVLLEVEGSSDGKGEGSLDMCLYEPGKALELSMKEWFSEFRIPRKNPEHYRPVKSTESLAKANNYEDLGSSKMDTSRPPVVSEVMHMTNSLPCPSDPSPSSQFSLDDVRLLIDYFYLPHMHGSRALHVLEEFIWLKENAPGYEVLKMHAHLKGYDEDIGEEEEEEEEEFKESKIPLPDLSADAGDGMRSDGETSESIAEDEEMTGADVRFHSCSII